MFSLPSISAIIAVITSPMGKYIGAGLIVVSAYFAGDVRGHRIEKAAWRASIEAANKKAQEADRVAHEQAAKDTQDTIKELNLQKDRADALELQLQNLPVDAACVYGADGQPVGSVRVPSGAGAGKARPAGPTVLPSAPAKPKRNGWLKSLRRG